MRPASSLPFLICLRSVARITPSLIGISYCLPVRLSVTVSVSAIVWRRLLDSGFRVRLRFRVVGAVCLGQRLAGHAIASVGPSRQVLVPAPLAAERPPAGVHGVPAAQDAQARLAHPTNSNQFVIGDWRLAIFWRFALSNHKSPNTTHQC